MKHIRIAFPDIFLCIVLLVGGAPANATALGNDVFTDPEGQACCWPPVIYMYLDVDVYHPVRQANMISWCIAD